MVLRIRSKQKDPDLDTYGASYREPGGRQINANEALGPTKLGADFNARVAVIFKKAKVGGVVTLEVSVRTWRGRLPPRSGSASH